MTASGPLWRTGLSILFAGIIISLVVLTLLPGDLAPKIKIWDKLLHVAAYMVLATVGALAFQGPNQWWRVLFTLVSMGILLEVGQGLVPGRYPEVADGLADALGAAIGVASFHWVKAWLPEWLVVSRQDNPNTR